MLCMHSFLTHMQRYSSWGTMLHQSRAGKTLAGQAVLLAIFITFLMFVAAAIGFVALVTVRAQLARQADRSEHAFIAAEAGIEDAIARIINATPIPAAYSLTLGDATADVIVAALGNTRTITSVGSIGDAQRKLEVTIELNTQGISFFYGIQVGDGGLEMHNNSTVVGSVYSDGDIIGSNGAEITGSAIVAGGISETPAVEWATHNADHFFATASSNRDIAQSFTATASDTVPRVSVYLGKVGTPGSNLTVRLTTDNGNKPATSSLASATIDPSFVGSSPSWIDVSFSTLPSVTNGSKYWIVLDYNSNSGTNYWNWRKDTGDGYANNTGKYTSNWSSGSATWTDVGGDLAFRVWIGGTVKKIQDMVINDGQANSYVNTTAQGTACPNVNCPIATPPREELPISEGLIQDWRDAAASGGTCAPPTCNASGDFVLTNGATASLGPIRVPGFFTLDNNAELTVTGTIWVEGPINLSNEAIVRLDQGYGPLSAVILTDDVASISNNVEFYGSGDPASFPMLLSAKNDPSGTVINVDNNSLGVVYYANNGFIEFSNNATAKEATAYGIEMDNNAEIVYDSGLANTQFSAGPSAGWEILRWREVE